MYHQCCCLDEEVCVLQILPRLTAIFCIMRSKEGDFLFTAMTLIHEVQKYIEYCDTMNIYELCMKLITMEVCTTGVFK